MADKYERLLMKEKIKEARHQARVNDLRRRKELAEIRERNFKSIGSFIVILVPALVILGMLSIFILPWLR